MPRPPKKPPGSPRGPAPSTDEGARNKLPRVSVPMTAAETAHLDAARKRLGLSRAEFMRRAVRAYAATSIGNPTVADSVVILGDGVAPLTWNIPATRFRQVNDYPITLRFYIPDDEEPLDYYVRTQRSGDAWTASVSGVDGTDALGATQDDAVQRAGEMAYAAVMAKFGPGPVGGGGR